MSKSRSKRAKPAQGAKRKTAITEQKAAKQQGSKQARLIEMLRSPEGATIAAMAKAFGWQPHTVRGVLSGALKKKLGLTIKSQKTEDGERVYRIG
jgi:hypothetical protein